MKKDQQKDLLYIKFFFNILSSGSQLEIREAKKEIKKFWNKNNEVFGKSKIIIFKIIDNFNSINEAYHKAAVISGMDLFFLALADNHFIKLKDFIVKSIQHPDGRVREAARKTSDWLYCSLTSRAEPFVYPEKKLLSVKQKKDQKIACQQYFEFVNELEILIDEYDDENEKAEYINEMKPSVNKSLQMLLVRLTDSPVYKRISRKPISIIPETLIKRKEIEQKLKKILEQTKSDFNLEDIKRIIYNEQDQNDLIRIIRIFDKGKGQSIDKLNEIILIINDAWNYFPHKCLKGFFPFEKLLEYQNKKE